ncbi:hypothetical protein GCM10022419_029640 [Nonomuraea rosea]|uniref:Uncharacterized protein n=1 Tax=Nonomuraea rosea TaxID=638574 RepID=A0ABP6WC32_9ACTN
MIAGLRVRGATGLGRVRAGGGLGRSLGSRFRGLRGGVVADRLGEAVGATGAGLGGTLGGDHLVNLTFKASARHHTRV